MFFSLPDTTFMSNPNIQFQKEDALKRLMVTLKGNSTDFTYKGQFTYHGVYYPACYYVSCFSRRALSSLLMACFSILLIGKCTFEFFCTWSLFFLFLCLSSRRICHCLARTAGECYLRSSLPPCLCLISALWGETASLCEEKQSRQEKLLSLICTLCFESSEDALSGACGEECVVLVWMRGRSTGGMLGVCRSLIKASRELWRLSMVLKAILPFPVAQLLALHLPSSLPIAWLLICFCTPQLFSSALPIPLL